MARMVVVQPSSPTACDGQLKLPRSREIVRQTENPALSVANQPPLLGGSLRLDLRPYPISHKMVPTLRYGSLVRPLAKINEFGPAIAAHFPHGDDMEAVISHDQRRMIAKPRMGDGHVVLEDLVEAKLVDHHPSCISFGGARLGRTTLCGPRPIEERRPS